MYSIPCCSSSYTSTLPSCLKAPNLSLSFTFSQLGCSHFTPWNGLRYTPISISPKAQTFGSRRKCKGKGVYASLFGVGAPEALVIGVVALLVFGPKGLAEVARNLGKTLRAFQPTIRELQDVSREFKSTLEREISLDYDDQRSLNNMNGSNNAKLTPSQQDEFQTTPVADPNGAVPNNEAVEEYSKTQEQQLNAATAVAQDATSENQIETASQPQAYSSEEYLKITEEQLKAAAAAAAQQNSLSSQSENQTDSKSQPQETAAGTPPIQKPDSDN